MEERVLYNLVLTEWRHCVLKNQFRTILEAVELLKQVFATFKNKHSLLSIIASDTNSDYRRFLPNHGNVATDGSPEPGLCPTLLSNDFNGSL